MKKLKIPAILLMILLVMPISFAADADKSDLSKAAGALRASFDLLNKVRGMIGGGAPVVVKPPPTPDTGDCGKGKWSAYACFNLRKVKPGYQCKKDDGVPSCTGDKYVRCLKTNKTTWSCSKVTAPPPPAPKKCDLAAQIKDTNNKLLAAGTNAGIKKICSAFKTLCSSHTEFMKKITKTSVTYKLCSAAGSDLLKK
ncbi:hypothetical protein ACFL0W_03835 [Nanoarchaeota archaeon]